MKLNTNLKISVAILLIAAGIYWYSSTRTGNQPSLTISGSENQVQSKFQTLVGELSSISFDTSIFSDARFNVLVDITTPIAPEPVGRLDPFAVVTDASVN